MDEYADHRCTCPPDINIGGRNGLHVMFAGLERKIWVMWRRKVKKISVSSFWWCRRCRMKSEQYERELA